MPDTPPQSDTIIQLFDAVYPSFALLAGLELDLFSSLKDGPLSAEALAAMLGVHAVKLESLLYVLVVARLLTVADGLFANTPEANHYLVRGKPTYIGGIHELTAMNWKRMLKTADTIRAGAPVDELDYRASTQEEVASLLRGLYPGTVEDARQLMAHHDFSTCRTLLDVGGGSGALAITLTQANPAIKATVIDLPSVIPITRQFVEEAKADDQVAIVAADAVRDALPGTFDVIVARHLVQVLPRDESRALLHNLAAALNPGGILILIGFVLDDSRVSPTGAVHFNLVLVTNYDSQPYTEQDYYSWLAETGLVNVERRVLPSGGSIVTARKPV